MSDLTPDQLDEARAREAHKQVYGNACNVSFDVLTDTDKACRVEAARLARTGWTPVDPDLIEAREIVARGHDACAASSNWHYREHHNEAAKVRAGLEDGGFRVSDTLAGIKRGRQLATGGADV